MYDLSKHPILTTVFSHLVSLDETLLLFMSKELTHDQLIMVIESLNLNDPSVLFNIQSRYLVMKRISENFEPVFSVRLENLFRCFRLEWRGLISAFETIYACNGNLSSSDEKRVSWAPSPITTVSNNSLADPNAVVIGSSNGDVKLTSFQQVLDGYKELLEFIAASTKSPLMKQMLNNLSDSCHSVKILI